MCLGIPGKVLSISNDALLTAKVSFGGIVKEVYLAYCPEAGVGDYVIVHAGFAISVIDQLEAQQTFRYLDEISSMPTPASSS